MKRIDQMLNTQGNTEFAGWVLKLQSLIHKKENYGVDFTDRNGDTPLHLATRFGNF